MQATLLEQYLAEFLEVTRYQDYAPNGLQIAGKGEVTHICCATTASMAAIDAAIQQNADALLVHHGYFWRGEDPRICGARGARISQLIRHGISMFAYHLPLDAHPQVGNNAQLARQMGWIPDGGRFGEQALGWTGQLGQATSAQRLATRIGTELGISVRAAIPHDRPLQRIGWCTGGAASYLSAASAIGLDAFITGEASEKHYHEAMEAGVALLAAGHHATERYGVQALAQHVSQQFGLTWCYHESDNPF